MEVLGLIVALFFGILIAIAIVWVIVGLAGATGDITAIAVHFESLCTKVASWWNGIYVAIMDSWESIVDFFESIASFFS